MANASAEDPGARLQEGHNVCVEGIARAAAPPIKAPVSGNTCLYWELKEGIDSKTHSHAEGGRIWLECGEERALVDLRHVDLDVRAQRREQAVRLAESDLQTVEKEIRKLKDARKHTYGPKLSAIQRRHHQLKQMATLLCAIRAHARGKIHVGGDAAGQERYITEQNQHFLSEGTDNATLRMTVERFEELLVEGQQISVRGRCDFKPAPAGSGMASHYRQAPHCFHLVGSASQPLTILGLGTSQPRSAAEKRVLKGERQHHARHLNPKTQPLPLILGLTLVLFVIIYLWL